jgi:uncharacterized protein
VRRARSLALCALLLGPLGAARADTALHSLWALHGKHNTVYVLGSIHTLRSSDYPLPPAVMDAYRDSNSLLMEIDVDELESPQVQAEMLQSAMLPAGRSLSEILGAARSARAQSLA